MAAFAALDPPFLEELMREGLGEDDDLPMPGKFNDYLNSNSNKSKGRFDVKYCKLQLGCMDGLLAATGCLVVYAGCITVGLLAMVVLKLAA